MNTGRLGRVACIAAVVWVTASQDAHCRERPRLAVAPFSVLGNAKIPDAGLMLAERLLPHFAHRFQLVDQLRLKDFLSQQKLTLAGIIAETSGAGRGTSLVKLKAVRTLVVGTLSCYPDGSYHVNARIVDWRSGQVRSNIAQATAKNWSEVMAQMAQIAVVLLEQRPTEKATVRHWMRRALLECQKIEEARVHDGGLYRIANVLWRSGDFDGALKAVDSLKNPRHMSRGRVLRDIAGALAKNGFVSRSLATAEKVSTLSRMYAYAEIAKSLHERRDASGRDRTLAIASNHLGDIGQGKYKRTLDMNRLPLIRALCAMGKIGDARSLVSKMTNRLWLFHAHCEIGQAEAKHVGADAARKSFNEALRYSYRRADRIDLTVGDLCRLAQAQHAAGLSGDAEANIRRALSLAGKPHTFRAGSYMDIGTAVSKMGQKERATSMFSLAAKHRGDPLWLAQRMARARFFADAIRMAMRLPPGSRRDQALDRTVVSQVEAGALLDAAKTAAKVSTSFWAARVYGYLVQCQVEAKDAAGAKQSVDILRRFARTTESEKERGYTLAVAAGAKIRLGDYDGFEAMLSEISFPALRVWAYCEAADALLLDGLGVNVNR